MLPVLCDLRQVLYLSGPAATWLPYIPNQDGMGNSATHSHLELLGFQAQASPKMKHVKETSRSLWHTKSKNQASDSREAAKKKNQNPPKTPKPQTP